MMSTTPILNLGPSNGALTSRPMNGAYSGSSKPTTCAGCKRTGLPLLVCDDCNSPSEVSSAGKWSNRYCAECMIGKKVRVFWPLDEQWYVGVVQRYDPGTGEHLLTYPDGDTEWVKIGDSPSNVAAAQADAMNSPSKNQHNNVSPMEVTGAPLQVTPSQGNRGYRDGPPSPLPPPQEQMTNQSSQQMMKHPYDSNDRSSTMQKLRASQQEHLSAISNNAIIPQSHSNNNNSNPATCSPETQQKQLHNHPPNTHGHMHGQSNQPPPVGGSQQQTSPPSSSRDSQHYPSNYSMVPPGGGGDWQSNNSHVPQHPASPTQQHLSNSSNGTSPHMHSQHNKPYASATQMPPHTPQSEGAPTLAPPYVTGPPSHHMAPPSMNYHHGGMPQQQMHPGGPYSAPPHPYLLPRPYAFPPHHMGGGMMPNPDNMTNEKNDSPDSNALGNKRKSGPKTWTKEEDAILLNMVQNMRMPMKWSIVAQSMPERTGKQCRERYVNHLNPRLKNAEWSPNEDATIFHLYNSVGSQWAKMSKMIPGRTDNGIKNRFHNLRRQLEREDEHRLRLSKPVDFPDEIHLDRIRKSLPDQLKGKNDQLWDMHEGLGILAAQSVIGAGIARNAGKYGPFRTVGKEGETCMRCGLIVPSVQCGTDICEKTKWCLSCTRIPPHLSGNVLRECLNLRRSQDCDKAKIIEAWISVSSSEKESKEMAVKEEQKDNTESEEEKAENKLPTVVLNLENENKDNEQVEEEGKEMDEDN